MWNMPEEMSKAVQRFEKRVNKIGIYDVGCYKNEPNEDMNGKKVGEWDYRITVTLKNSNNIVMLLYWSKDLNLVDCKMQPLGFLHTDQTKKIGKFVLVTSKLMEYLYYGELV